MSLYLIFLYKDMVDLSNEVLYVKFCQDVVKLQALKVSAVWESRSSIYYDKLRKIAAQASDANLFLDRQI